MRSHGFGLSPMQSSINRLLAFFNTININSPMLPFCTHQTPSTAFARNSCHLQSTTPKLGFPVSLNWHVAAFNIVPYMCSWRSNNAHRGTWHKSQSRLIRALKECTDYMAKTSKNCIKLEFVREKKEENKSRD